MEVLGWILWVIGLVVGLSWSYGVRTYVRTGQGVQQQTVNQTTLILLSVIAVPLFGISPFHLLWMLPAAFIAGMLSLAFPFSLVSLVGRPFGELCCIGLDKGRDRSQSRTGFQELVAGASAPTGDSHRASREQLSDNYRALGASDAQANLANEIAHQIYETSWRSAAYLATTSFDPDPKTVVMVCRELQYFFTYLLASRVMRDRGEQAGGLLCAMLGSFGTEYLQRVSQRTIGTSLPDEINAEEFQEAFAEYYSSAEEIPTQALCDRIALHLDSDRSSSINNLVSHVLGRGSFTGFQEAGVPTIDLGRFVSQYLAV